VFSAFFSAENFNKGHISKKFTMGVPSITKNVDRIPTLVAATPIASSPDICTHAKQMVN